MKVSIVIPVYNVEKFIRRCLVSIQKQSLPDIEIIVINDETSDNSMAIVKVLAMNDDRIVILEHEANQGPMCARETGYMAATGDYITFCDSDDYMPKDALEVLYNEAIKTGADVVSGNFSRVSVDGKEKEMRNELTYGNKPEQVYKALLRNELKHSLWGKLFRRSLLQDYKYQTYAHATNGEDGCLFYQIVQHVNYVVQIEDCVYFYMQNVESSTQRRYNENAIKSICITHSIKVKTVSDYPNLIIELNKNITNCLCQLYAKGYGRGVNLKVHIHQNGLDGYVSWRNIFRYLNRAIFFKILVARIVRDYIWKR